MSFASDCSINVQHGGRLFTYDAQVSSMLQLPECAQLRGHGGRWRRFSGNGGVGNGSAYSATALGASISPGGYLFTFGIAGGTNAISASGQTLPVPVPAFAGDELSGRHASLGASVNGAQTNQTFVVHYSDNSTQTFSQNFSDWGSRAALSGRNDCVHDEPPQRREWFVTKRPHPCSTNIVFH